MIKKLKFLPAAGPKPSTHLKFLLAVFFAFAPAQAHAQKPSDPCADRLLRVGIDVGHSRLKPGATSAYGKSEFAFNQRFATELLAKSQNRKEAAVALELFIHNPGGAEMKLSARPARAQRLGAEVLLSIHHDSVQRQHLIPHKVGGRSLFYTPKIRGFSLFISRRNPRFNESWRLATLIGRSFHAAGMTATDHHAEDVPGERRKFLDRDIGLYQAPFTVVAAAKIPAVLVELGVIVNRDEERQLEQPEHRAHMQLALLDALAAYCAGRIGAR
jgi:N-acetylmuramoyl-L-alanine amidase